MTDRETPAGAVEALTAALQPAETLTSKDGIPATAIVIFGDRQNAAEVITSNLRASGYSLTRSVDVERWQRIETAAREVENAFLANMERGYAVPVFVAIDELRVALGPVR